MPHGMQTALQRVMKTTSIGALFLTLATSSCGDDASRDVALGNGLADQDAAVLLDANLADTSTVHANPGDTTKPDAAADAQIEGTWVPPSSPSAFTLTLESGRCFGSCPEYRVSIDQTGKVEFVGGYCSARPGPYEKQVAPTAASSLYAALVSANFWSLRDRYADKNTPECPQFLTDGETNDWRAEVDGHVKTIERYEGCMGNPSLAALDALVDMVTAQSATDAWISDPGNSCRIGAAAVKLASSYQLARDGQTLGLLTFDDMSQWRLTDCAGAELLKGHTSAEYGRVVLQQRKQLTEPLGLVPIVLPQGVGTVGTVVIETNGTSGVKARGLRADGEVALTLTEATGC